MRYVLFVLLFHFSITINTQTLKVKETFSDSLFQKWDSTFELKNNTVLNLTCPKIDTVRIAVIGLGNRGSMALERLPQIQNVKIVAIADIDSVKGGLGSFILSTNQGLMTDKDAKAKNVGGEVLCEVF